MTDTIPSLCTQCQQPLQPTDHCCGACGTPRPSRPVIKPVWKRWHKVVVGTCGSLFLLLLGVLVLATLVSPPEASSPPSAADKAKPAVTPAVISSPKRPPRHGSVPIEAETGKVTPATPAPTPPAVIAVAPTTPRTAGMPALTHSAAGTPERALAEYLHAWAQQDWTRMARWTQRTWNASEADPAGTLAGWNDWKTLTGYAFVRTDTVSATCVDIVCILHFKSAVPTPHPVTNQVTVRLVKEMGPRAPSPSGSWGVHPLVPSMAT